MDMQMEAEHERYMCLLSILRKAMLARQDGYFTDDDIQDMKREFGLTFEKEIDDELENATNECF